MTEADLYLVITANDTLFDDGAYTLADLLRIIGRAPEGTRILRLARHGKIAEAHDVTDEIADRWWDAGGATDTRGGIEDRERNAFAWEHFPDDCAIWEAKAEAA